MTDEEKLLKNQKISAGRKATALRRRSMSCCTYQLKIDMSKLSKKQKECLKMMFVEAKWIYNDIISWMETRPLKDWKESIKAVAVKTKDGEFELRELKYIGSGMIQDIKEEIGEALKSLATKKTNGVKAGALSYQSEHTSLSFSQLDRGKGFIRGKHTVKIPKVKGLIIVNGLDQLKPDMELAEAKLLNTPRGYYIHITTFQKKELEIPTLPEIGIDMGIKTHITTSEGKKINAFVGETERLKKLQRSIARKKKGSNNRRKARLLMQREYQKLTNRKNDLANKVVHELLKHERVYMQDENLIGWKSFKFGKTIQHSILGRVKAKLVSHERVVVLERYVPTSKLCICGNKKTDLKLLDRVYKCEVCGYEEDRGVHAAKNMIRLGKLSKETLAIVPTGRREITPVENKKSLFDEAGRD